MAEVKFCVHADEVEGTYGITLYADPGDEVQEVPCFRSCFTGEPGMDPDEVVELFSSCHQDAMEEVGLTGSKSQTRVDVCAFEIGIIPKDGLSRLTCRQQAENI